MKIIGVITLALCVWNASAQEVGTFCLLARASHGEAAARRQTQVNDTHLRLLFSQGAYAYYRICGATAKTMDSLRRTGLFDYVEKDARGEAAAVRPAMYPDDPWFARQWSLYNDGTFSVGAVNDADADVTEAWSITHGSDAVIVAVLDTGIDTDHPELSGRLWVNTREVAGNGVDDDHNGYIDDVSGWNFVAGNALPEDDQGHGTHVAGVIGATGNNASGMAGVDWHCRLMNCKVLSGSDGSGYYSWWAEAIHYAVDNGADIINMSLGGADESRTLEDAVDYARSRNVLVVVSMQNANSEKPYYPAACASTLAVGATDVDDRRCTSFGGSSTYGSNFGSHLDVVAPGNYIYSLSRNTTTVGNMLSGTSQAAPLVSGIAALILAHSSMHDVALLEQRILRSAEDRVGDPSEDTPGWDMYYGYGRVNAYNAIMSTDADAWQPMKVFPNPASTSVNIRLDQSIDQQAVFTLHDVMGRAVYSATWTSGRMIDTRIDLDHTQAGLYMLTVENAKQRFQRKIVKK